MLCFASTSKFNFQEWADRGDTPGAYLKGLNHISMAGRASTNSSQYIAQVDLNAMMAAYDGKRSILTMGIGGIEWAPPRSSPLAATRITGETCIAKLSVNIIELVTLDGGSSSSPSGSTSNDDDGSTQYSAT